MSVLQYAAAKSNKLPILPCWAYGGARNSSSSFVSVAWHCLHIAHRKCLAEL